jgi:hypothetical protein
MDMGSNRPTTIHTYLQATVQQSTPEKTRTSSKSGLWRPKTGDHTCTPAAGAAALKMEEGPNGMMPPRRRWRRIARRHLLLGAERDDATAPEMEEAL